METAEPILVEFELILRDRSEHAITCIQKYYEEHVSAVFDEQVQTLICQGCDPEAAVLEIKSHLATWMQDIYFVTHTMIAEEKEKYHQSVYNLLLWWKRSNWNPNAVSRETAPHTVPESAVHS